MKHPLVSLSDRVGEGVALALWCLPAVLYVGWDGGGTAVLASVLWIVGAGIALWDVGPK